MDKTTAITLGIALILIMLGMGVSLIPKDFKNVLKYPKAVAIGLINQLLLLPIIGFSIAYFFPMQPEIAVGLMILASCPGGATSNLICFLAKADLALSVTLTAISSIISVFTIPIVMNFSIAYFMGENQSVELSLLKTIGQIGGIVIIPVIVGMIIRYYKPVFAEKANKAIKIFSIAVLSLLIIGVVAKERAHFVSYLQQSGLATVILTVATFSIGLLSAKLFGLNSKQALTVSIESGIQNSTLAITIAIVLLEKTSFAVAPSIYSLTMYITAVFLIFISNKKKGQA